MVNEVLLAIGANLTSSIGPPEVTIQAAWEQLRSQGATIRGLSPLYSTPAFPAGNGPDYVNAAARISASWTPEETLAICHRIEAGMDRVREERWGQRTLDLDVIACGGVVLPDARTQAMWRDLPLNDQMARAPDQLILPHPRMQDRAFVLVPLADVAPDWMHPVLGKTVLQMRDALNKAALKDVRILE